MNVRCSWLVAPAAIAATSLTVWASQPFAPPSPAPAVQETKAPAKDSGPQLKVDEAIPSYKPTSGVAGNLNSVGSDTLINCMTLWGEGYKTFYPNVHFQSEGKGSATAPPALINGTAQLGPMSREMKASEIDEFEKKFGYKPTRVRVAIDALAIYVNKDNPIEKLTLAQADAIFSKQHKRGFPKDVTTWGDLGLTGEWAQLPISTYGRNSASGTYGFFKEHVLNNGDYKDTVKEQPGSATVVQNVTEDRGGIGYSGIGYRTSGVRPVPLTVDEKTPASDVSPANVYGGKYPITRFLYVYVNKPPNKPLDPLVKEFISYVLSQQGQQVVLKDGYLPLPAKIVAEELHIVP